MQEGSKNEEEEAWNRTNGVSPATSPTLPFLVTKKHSSFLIFLVCGGDIVFDLHGTNKRQGSCNKSLNLPHETT